MLPQFDSNGNLPEGIHWAAWQEINERFGKTRRRRELLVGLKAALTSLKRAGCNTVYIDGSFATAEENPKDYDCCWDPDGVEVALLENMFLHPTKQGRLVQKMKYGGEFFLTDAPAAPNSTFLKFFQKDRDGNTKGIVAIDLRNFQ